MSIPYQSGGTGRYAQQGGGGGGRSSSSSSSFSSRVQQQPIRPIVIEGTSDLTQPKITGAKGFVNESEEILCSTGNREAAAAITNQLWTLCWQITEEFHTEGNRAPPLFLINMFGTYVPRSLFNKVWERDATEQVWINDAKIPIAKWKLTDGQVKIRFKMIKALQERGTSVLKEMGYARAELLFTKEVLWPSANRIV